jgi:hypothetical protein
LAEVATLFLVVELDSGASIREQPSAPHSNSSPHASFVFRPMAFKLLFVA